MSAFSNAGTLASLHRYPIKSMMGGILKTAARHNNVHIGAYASLIQAGQVRIGDAVSIV